MPLAPLLSLMLLAAQSDSVVSTAPSNVPPQTAPATPPETGGGPDDIPPGAPTDDYGLVAWCYGALGEYLSIYDEIKPDLKDIDKRFGTPVVEAEPYHEDMAQARLALKRFADAMDSAEKASAQPIAAHGAQSIDKGRGIWSVVRLKSRRNLVDAWLFWGVPERCETTAKALQTRSTLLGQAMAASQAGAEEPAKAADKPSKPD